VTEETVAAGAVPGRMRFLELGTILAVDVGEEIAFEFGAFEGVEDETVLAQLLFGHALGADVIFVALELVLVLAVLSGAFKLSSGQGGASSDEEESVLHD